MIRLCDDCKTVRGKHYCAPRAQHVVNVFQQALVHTKGTWARQPFLLAPWQLHDIIEPLFGRIEYSSEYRRYVRQYRIAWIELARKNGKSELLAGIGLYMLSADGEEGAEVYGAACDRDQARKVWDVAAAMLDKSPTLQRMVERGRLSVHKNAKRIIDEVTGSYYQVVAADAAGNLGHNPHCVLFDEVITQPSRELWDAFSTSFGTRHQPLMIAATTAGNDPSSFAADEHAYCEQIARAPKLDRRRFVFMRNTPSTADWRDETRWEHANPALGDFLSLEALRDEARAAALSPSKELAFRQFRLNQWVRSATRFIDLLSWDKTAQLVDEQQLAHARCFGGLDLASTTDLAAIAWHFPPEDQADEHAAHRIVWRHFAPSERLDDLDRRTAGNASVWAKQGFLTLTPGNVIDYDTIRSTILRDAQTFDVVDIGYDPWNAAHIVQQLLDEGCQLVAIRQGFASLSAPTKEFERLVLSKRYAHGGNPIVRWQAAHVIAQRDPAGNVKLDKAHSHEKIDGLAAAVMALDRAMRTGNVRRSAYEDSGIVSV